MNTQQAENLRILIRHMESGAVKELEMLRTDHLCGTPCCAIGEARRIGIAGADREANDVGAVSPSAARAFGLTPECHGPMSWGRLFGTRINGDHRPTPAQWCAEARKVLCENGYSMDEPKAIPSVREALDGLYASNVMDEREQRTAMLDAIYDEMLAKTARANSVR